MEILAKKISSASRGGPQEGVLEEVVTTLHKSWNQRTEAPGGGLEVCWG